MKIIVNFENLVIPHLITTMPLAELREVHDEEFGGLGDEKESFVADVLNVRRTFHDGLDPSERKQNILRKFTFICLHLLSCNLS